MLNDFCGFTFNGIHTSELNILRVSNGSRYNDTLIPSFQDKTAQIEGGDGALFWDSYYNNKPISIQIAFDSLTEAQLRKLRQVFSAKAIGEFILMKTPIKHILQKYRHLRKFQIFALMKVESAFIRERVQFNSLLIILMQKVFINF